MIQKIVGLLAVLAVLPPDDANHDVPIEQAEVM
jgi:hypothetical protein